MSLLDPVCCCALNPKTPPPSSAPADPGPRPAPTLVPLLDVRSVSADLGGRQQVSTRFLLSGERRPCYPLKVTISSVTGAVCVTSWKNKKKHIRNSGLTLLSDLRTVDKKLFILKKCRIRLSSSLCCCFSWDQGGKQAHGGGNGQRERGRGFRRGNGIWNHETSEGVRGGRPGRGVCNPLADEGRGPRAEEGEEGGLQLAGALLNICRDSDKHGDFTRLVSCLLFFFMCLEE